MANDKSILKVENIVVVKLGDTEGGKTNVELIILDTILKKGFNFLIKVEPFFCNSLEHLSYKRKLKNTNNIKDTEHLQLVPILISKMTN